MRIIITIILCSCLHNLYAQYDDLPDYRSKKDNFLKMQEKDIRADVSQFTFGGIAESLTKHRLDAIPLIGAKDDTLVFSNDTTTFQITTGSFDPTQHKITWYDDKYAVKIDNHAFFGTQYTVPKHTITSVIAIIDADTVVVPLSAFADLYEPKFYFTDANGNKKTYCNVYRSADKRKYYIYMLNGEGNGRYEVTWVIEDKHYLRRVVDWDF
ncbi:MAG: hypothetical protein JST21_00285 [Bacteroidetes bacterium]|nr:hypothetical protein [Bacteroidota bacterium]